MRTARRCSPGGHSQGVVLLDALIAIVIFSIGIVGMVALQSAATKLSRDAKYRSDAAMAVDQVVAQMWVSNPGTLSANFKSPEGAQYKTWAATLTSLSATQGLPGVREKAPVIEVSADNIVTVTLYWRAPGDDAYHRYVSTTHIAR
ncbi:type IV pilus modification PilV family protein [Dyella koreensis]|uniref:Type IV pilus modification protein PilV n=1 Tax=Dyella koreensis TaxID=311235 RepID=A0ABW8K7Z0_9GAMM